VNCVRETAIENPRLTDVSPAGASDDDGQPNARVSILLIIFQFFISIPNKREIAHPHILTFQLVHWYIGILVHW
jgi:hypothetical protein